MAILLIVACGALGFLLGGVLNRVIARAPLGAPLFGSHPQPDASPGRRSPLVTLATGLLFAFLMGLHGPSLRLVVAAFHTCVLLVVLVIDLERLLIPDVIILPATALALGLSLIESLLGSPVPPSGALFWSLQEAQVVSPAVADLLARLLGGASSYLVMALLRLVASRRGSEEAVGLGDAKLAAYCGVITGWPGALWVLLGASVLGSLTAAALLLSRRARRGTAMPYGPFFAVAAYVVMILQGWHSG